MAGIKSAKELLKKTPDEVVIRDFEFAGDDLASGETIASIMSVTITRIDGQAMGGSDLTKDSQAFSGTRVQLILSKGILNVTYEVHIKVTTSAGQTLEACGKMQIKPC